MNYSVGDKLVRRDVLGGAGYPERVEIVDYDSAYRRWILVDGVEMTSASLDYLYMRETDQGGYA